MDGRQVLEADGVRAFAVFAEHLNFTAAAARLNLSQPSLHAKIRKLQAELGVDLYLRDGRGLTLTAAGRRLTAFAHDTAQLADDVLADLHATSAPVQIAAGQGTFRWVVGDGVRRLADSGRAVRVLTADRAGSLDAVRSGRVDVAVIAHDPPPPDLRSAHLATYPQTLVLPPGHLSPGHRLRGRRSVRLRDLDGLALVVPPPGRPHRRSLDVALLEAGVTWSVAAEVDGWDLLTHFCALGLGPAVVNGCVPPPPGLTAVPVRDLPSIRYWAVWRAERDRLARDVVALLHPDDGASRR